VERHVAKAHRAGHELVRAEEQAVHEHQRLERHDLAPGLARPVSERPHERV
jgi:hypothetical protein